MVDFLKTKHVVISNSIYINSLFLSQNHLFIVSLHCPLLISIICINDKFKILTPYSKEDRVIVILKLGNVDCILVLVITIPKKTVTAINRCFGNKHFNIFNSIPFQIF